MQDLSCVRKHDFYLFDLTSSKAKACCRSPFNASTQSLQEDLDVIVADRLAMKMGQQVPNCNTCWTLENSGAKSFRTMDPYSPTQIVSPETHNPVMVQFITGTKCNLRCIYCGPQSSSMWETPANASLPAAPLSTDMVKFLRDKWDTIGMFSFIGGEPSIIPEVFSIIEILKSISIEKNWPRKKRIGIISNLAAPATHFRKFLDHLKAIEPYFSTEIGISAESSDERFEYIRDGSSFSVFQKNLNAVMEEREMAAILHCTLNVLSVSRFHEFVEGYLKTCAHFGKKVNLAYNEVVHPSALSPRRFPFRLDSELASLKRSIESIPLESIASVKSMQRFTEPLYQLYTELGSDSFASSVAFLDAAEASRLKKLHWRQVFPELAEFCSS